MKKSFTKTLIGNLILILSVCLSVAGQHQLQKETSEIQPLAFGQTIEKEISPMQKHRYQIQAKADQFIKIEVKEKLCDVVISLRSPDNTNILEYKEPDIINGDKVIQAAIAETGNYELRIVSFGEENSTGNYSVKIAEIRPATEQELNFTAGVKLFNESFNAVNPALSTVEALRTSIQKGNVALEKFSSANAFRNVAFTLRQLSAVHFKLGETTQSIELALSAIEKYRSIYDKKGETYTLMILGDIYTVLGDMEKAAQAFNESLKISRENKIETMEIDSLIKLGDVYANFGDYDRAAIYYKQSGEITKQYSNITQSRPFNDLGKISFYKGENEKALEYFQKALETVRLEEHRLGTTKASEANLLNNIGRTQYELGKRDKAIESFNESLSITAENVNKDAQAATLRYLGKIYFENGEIEKSLALFDQSLAIYRAVEDTQNAAETLLFSAKAEIKKGDLQAAQSKTEEAIKLIETIRINVKTAELRDSFSANLQSFYEVYVEVLMRRHAQEPGKNYAALAFEANEKRKARGLLNLLNESNANIREGVEAKLLAKENELKNLLSARLENLTRILSKKVNPETIEILKREIEGIRSEYEQTQIQIRQKSPRYSALTQPKTLDLAEIKKEIIDADSVMLEYHLGETKCFVWVISKDKFQAIELPAKSDIEEKSRLFYDSLTTRNKRVKFETFEEKEARISQADSKVSDFANDLSRLILKPVENYIGNKKLLIVADGALQYIPFASLNNPKSEDRFLIETNEIVNLPSASVLAVLRKETANRKSASKTLAVFADPVFDTKDERFQTIANKKKTENKIIETVFAKNNTRAFGENENGFELPRLKFTRREADLISRLLPADQRREMLDFDANRNAVFKGDLANYRFIHFATHGFINNENPELSGIVLSLIDENGKEQNGFLRVSDIYNLKIPAEMVVLSGCRTGLGKEIKGEGLVGLTRGFMYAGAKRVAVSLWDVNDEATSELMAKFYAEMLGNKKLSPASALRQAQIALIKDKNRNNPYYWAAFTLQGEPR